ncbi:Squamosa promoter-binding-like protein 12 [Apostasia shenzhenica]|uniref:Squamosa promoter-binding-like protein 12 n=1 Tax=Apostasia shenzhenica TaxID=1088818 RepID=A0A2I0B433_9ASPA|nr:Squamosa promoter-binding-like protein 12 [Apostasia shenzhenica]
MDWNHKDPLQWDWENSALFNGKEDEISKSTGENGWKAEVGVISNSSVYSSGSGTFCISDLGNCSSKSSISVSVGSSPKVGNNISEVNFEAAEVLIDNQNNNNEFDQENVTQPSPILVGRASAAEPPIGLKLGKRTYFENFGAANIKTTSVSMTKPAASVKRSRGGHQAIQLSYCQVEGCCVDLAAAKDYHRKHRVCESHSKSPKVIVSGLECRFCQQCSRFHDLSEFDQRKRSCRRRLSDHNARRRKPQPDSITFTSSGFSSSSYDERQQMNFFLNLAPYSHSRGSTSSLWGDSRGFSLSVKKGSWINSTKVSVDGQLSIPNLSNTVSAPRDDYNKMISFKSIANEVLNQGLEASVSASNMNGAPDLRRALSLLSSDSWAPPCSEKSSTIVQFASSGPAVGSHPPNLVMESEPECWPYDHFLADQALNFRLIGSQVHDYNNLNRPPYENPLFEANGQFLEFKT